MTVKPYTAASFEVITTAGRAVSLELRLYPGTFEVWRDDAFLAVFNREHLRGWIANPQSRIRVGDVTFGVDYLVDRNGRISITVHPDIHNWTLSPRERHDLAGQL